MMRFRRGSRKANVEDLLNVDRFRKLWDYARDLEKRLQHMEEHTVCNCKES